MGRLIKDIAPKLPDIGRLRAGEKGKKGEPKRLDTWRLTSRDRVVVDAFASRYGGQVEPWEGHDGEFEVVSDTAEIQIFLPPDPLMSAYERWGSGGCKRRCDGEMCDVPIMDGEGGRLEEQECECAAKGWTPGDQADVKKGACAIAVRLRVIDPYAPGMGIYLLTSGSRIAAAELPGQVGLLRQMAETGAYVPASLAIEQREEKKAWEKYKRQYNVPVLRIRRSPAQMAQLGAADAMREQLAAAPAALVGGTAGALPAGNGNRGGEGEGSGAVIGEEQSAPAAPQPPPPSNPPKTPPKSGATGRGYVTSVERAVARLGLDDDEITALYRHVAGCDDAAGLTDPAQGNAMLAAVKSVLAGDWKPVYSDDGVTWDTGEEPVQGELVGGES